MESTTNVRSLLKNERKARRINHPHASYNSAGILACRICHIQLKAESLWDQHLSGSHHRIRLQERAQQQKHALETAGRKRKAGDSSNDEEDEGESRKKTKPDVGVHSSTTVGNNLQDTSSTENVVSKVDEAEWAAFIRDVATPPPELASTAPAVLSSNATITAAPVTAQELAARSRAEASTQAKESRETEIEEEKEDAARRIEEEFEEMEGLEERVRKLRERRERLRRDTTTTDQNANSIVNAETVAKGIAERESPDAIVREDTDGEEDDDDEEDIDDLAWRLIR